MTSALLERMNDYIANYSFMRMPQGLYAPIEYVMSMGGKRIRPLLMLMAYNLYRDDVDTILAPALGIEMYHNYTLLHDDLMDDADRRRGKKTVHKVWNANAAILSGDAMLILAYRLMAQVHPDVLKEIMDLFSQTALEICEGQQLDVEFEQREDVSVSEYIEMIRLKTAVLLATSLKIGALLAGASAEDAEWLYSLGIDTGLAFQLKDDYLDVYGDTALFGKNIGGDILNNKKTYLLLQAYEHADAGQRTELHRLMADSVLVGDEKIAAVTAYYNQLCVKTTCEEKMIEYTRCALDNLHNVNVPEAKKDVLNAFIKKLLNRNV
ncbi:MAG: polyprenyl synthetase family protein [Prevotellaceae bacterium]|jgi:geranylgeranyl diphosphate synthase type II|nr:polyprenyl synthetase family protein [Prevotellaceae bacterium]